MGKIAVILTFLILVHSTDSNENRRHVHIYRNKRNLQDELAKIWIEKNGTKDIEFAYSDLTAKEEDLITQALLENWDTINNQIELVFSGSKVKIINL